MGPIFQKFERENLENNTLYSSNFDFIVLKSQICVELCTANSRTEKNVPTDVPSREQNFLFS